MSSNPAASSSSSQDVSNTKALFRSMRDPREEEEEVLADPPEDASTQREHAELSTDAVPSVTAQLVDEAQLVNEERERIREEAMRNVSDQAVKADVVTNADVASETRNRLIFFIALLVSVCVAVVLGVVLGTQSSSDASEVFPTSAPTPLYINKDSVFRTTEELYTAVDAYFASYNANITTNTTAEATPDVILRYGPIGSWDVSQITNFSRLFDPIRNDTLSWDTVASEYYLTQFGEGYTPTAYDPRQFNEDLSAWDVSNAETMMGMFSRADFFVGFGLENWNVGKVQDFSFMFMGASVFNGNLSNWNTSSAETMEAMFLGSFFFDDNLSAWDVSRVKYMNHMFYFTESFLGDGIESWNVSQLTTMESMFTSAAQFNGDVSDWDVSRVITMTQAFLAAVSFNRNLSRWDVSQVESTNTMFSFAYSFDGDVSTWNMTNNRDFGYMFSGCVSFTSDLSQWDVSNAGLIVEMFNGAALFTGEGLSNWKFGPKIIDLEYMFNGAASFNGNISSWDVSRVQFMDFMFAGATSFNQDLSSWNVSRVHDATSMFFNAQSFQQDLCTWENLIPSTALLVDMFTNSSCPFPLDPFSNGTASFFCTQCSSSV